MTDGPAASRTFPALLLDRAARHGDRPAILRKRRGIWSSQSWGAFRGDVARLAAALAARGLGRGDRLAVIGSNRPGLFTALAAAQSLGALPAPLYHDAPGDEVAPWLRRLEPALVFAENQEQVDKVLAALPDCPSIRWIVYDEDRGMRPYRQPQLVARRALLEEVRGAADLAALAAAVAPGDPAFVFFTTGTAGTTRAVVQTHGALIARADAIATAEGVTAEDRTLAYLSPGWSGQMMFSYVLALRTGACICCPESSDTLLSDLREIAPTRFVATPRVLEYIRNDVDRRMAATGGLRLRLYRSALAAGTGGGPVPAHLRLALTAPLADSLGLSQVRGAYATGDAVAPDLAGFFRALGVNLRTLYGATETGYFDALQTGPVAGIGRAMPGAEITLSPEGEVLVRGDGLFQGYLGDPAATAAAKTAEGWFRTGDKGARAGDGGIRLVDRLSDLGSFADGSPFSPKEVERRLVALPEIAEAVAIGRGLDGVFALIDLDTATIAAWADSHDIAFVSHGDLALRPEIGALVGACIARVNAELAAAPGLSGHAVRRFVLLPAALSPASGLLTPTGKVRRARVEAVYAGAIAAMASGAATARLPSEAAAEGEVAAPVHDVPAPGRSAERKAS